MTADAPRRGGLAGHEPASPSATCTCWSAGPGRWSGPSGWYAARRRLRPSRRLVGRRRARRPGPRGGPARRRRRPGRRPAPRPRGRWPWCGAPCSPTSRTRLGRGAAAGRAPDRRRRCAGVAAGAALATGQVGDAAAHATEALRADPYDEAALRTLMRGARGRRPTGVRARRVRAGPRAAGRRARRRPGDPRPARCTRSCCARSPPADRCRTVRGRSSGRARPRDRRPRRRARPARASGPASCCCHRRARPRQDRPARQLGRAAAAARGVVVLRGRGRGRRARPAAGRSTRWAAGGADLVPWRRARVAGLPGPGATPDALSLRRVRPSRRRRPVPARPATDRARARRRRRRRPGDLGLAGARSGAVSSPRARRRRPPRPARPVSDADLAGPLGARRPCWSARRPALSSARRQPAAADRAARAAPGEGAGPSRGGGARLRRTGPAADAAGRRRPGRRAIDLDLLAAVVGRSPLDVARAPRHRGAAGLPRRARGHARVPARARPARRRGRGRDRPAGLAPPAGGRGAARPAGRAPARARPPRARGRRPGAGRRGAGAAPPTSPCARLDLAGAERLLDEAIALHDEQPRSGCGAAGCGCRAATSTAPTRTPRTRWPPTRPARRSSCAPGRPATGTTSTAPSGWGGPRPATATDPTIRASSLIAVAFGHRGNGDLARRPRRCSRRPPARRPSSACRPGRACSGCTRAAPPRRWPPSSRCSAPRRAAATQGFWVEHTLQMTAHAYGLLGRSADALRVLDRLERELERRGTGGAVRRRPAHLPQLDPAQPRRPGRRGPGPGRASDWPGPRRSSPSATSTWPTACCGPATSPEPPTGSRSPQPESGTRWFHNKWRFDQRAAAPARPARAWPSSDAGGGPRRRPSRWWPPPRSAATSGTPCSAGWSGPPRRRGSARPSTLAQLDRRPGRARRGGGARGLVAGRRRGRRDRLAHAPGDAPPGSPTTWPARPATAARRSATVAARRLG